MNLLQEKSDETVFAVSDKITKHAKELEQKYPDAYHRRPYHALFGSTPPSDATIGEDFPGNDSVLTFLNTIKKELSESSLP